LEVERVEKIGKGLKGEGRGERGMGDGEWGVESGTGAELDWGCGDDG